MDEISSDFTNTAHRASETMKNQQNKLPPKDGQVAMQCVLDTYTGLTEDKKTYSRDTPPAPLETSSKDKKKKWNKDIDMYVKLVSLNQVENVIETTVDPKTGNIVYTVSVEANYWDEKTKTYLKDKAAHAWSHDDPDSIWLRNFVTEDGTILTRYKRKFVAGDIVKAGAPDRKNNILRSRLNDKSTIFKVQPGAPLRMYNVIPVSYIQVKKVEVKNEDEDAAAAAAADDNNPTAMDLDNDNNNDDAVDGTETPKRMEERLSVSFKFKCKGYVSLDEENYDPTLERSERMHISQKKDVHNMVPIEKLREDPKSVPRTAYFYVSAGYQTRFNGDPKQVGVCIIREDPPKDETHLPTSNFLRERDGEESKPTFKASATVFQYFGKHNKETWDMYNVQFVSLDKTDTDWRKWGITDPQRYGYILAANRTVPIHIEAELWTSSVINSLSNSADELRKKPEMARMQGYYTYGVKNFVVDFLRHFKLRGIRVSPEWVEHDFRGSCMTKGNGRKIINLRPVNPEKRNPINSGGLQSNVLALGNGIMQTSDITGDEFPINHAWEGNLLTLLEAQTHDFYVLLSHALTKEEIAQYAQGEQGHYADEWVNQLITNNDIFYWIYAVRKDAKMAQDFLDRNKKLVPVPGKQEEEAEAPTPKRERSESESESHSSSSAGTPSRRSTRQRRKKNLEQELSE